MTLKNAQISKIEIKGFKSLKNCSVNFDKINILIGSNGAGKSNFISAFLLIQNILDENLQLYAAKNGINSLFYNGRKTTEEICFEIYFGLNSYGFTLIPTDDNRIIFREEHFEYHNNYENRSNLSRGHGESRWRQGAGNHLDEYIIPVLNKQSWRVYHFHDTGRDAKVKQEHNLSNSMNLQFDAANLAAFLYRLKYYFTKDYIEIVQTIRLIAPYFEDFILEPQAHNPEQIVLRWKQEGCEDVFNASQLSDGTLRFICLVVLLLQPAELQPETIIIDEPELGLHPYAITVLAEMVKQISMEKQIIISTQSVELLNEFDVEDIIVVNHGEEGTALDRPSAEDLTQWIEEYTLGDLWKKNLLGGRLSR